MAMLRNRLLIFLGGCFLAASAAKADGVAYIDCASHPEETQVFGKPRRTPESVASLACGERFTILLYGFIFSRIQTKDGQIGYVYSSLITPDHSGATVQQPSAARTPAAPATPAPTTAQPSAAAATPAPAQAQAQVQVPAQVQAQTQVAAAASTPPAAAPVATPKLLDAAAVAEVNSRAAVTPESDPSGPGSPQSNAPEASSAGTAPSTATPDTQAATASAAIVDPNALSVREAPAAAEQPEPVPAQPTAAVRPASMKESWEKPNPVARTVGARNVGLPRLPLIELFGGYGYARLNNGAGYVANSNGVFGSFGWNIKPWLQLIADSSYNRVTVSGTKNVLYGNHWGIRYFRRLRHSWGAAPFVEGLIGGSRADTTVSGAGGYSTSDTALSYKIGGGVDIHPLKHFEIRVIDFDYYRTSFGNLHQNNYFISTGLVMRLFGRSEE
jgi:hypothetical protein